MKASKKGCCSCRNWQENIKRNNNGQRWIKYLLTYQILFFISYNVINALNHRQAFLEYEVFILIVLFWLTSAAVIFYRNVVTDYRIGEMTPFTFSVIAINLYMLSKMVVSGVIILDTKIREDGKWNSPDILIVV